MPTPTDISGVGTWRCRHCDANLRRHMRNGQCLFAATKFRTRHEPSDADLEKISLYLTFMETYGKKDPSEEVTASDGPRETAASKRNRGGAW